MNLAFQFGRAAAGLHEIDHTVTLTLPNPVISGPGHELWASRLSTGRACGRLTLWRQDDELWGAGTASVGATDFAAAAHDLYRDIFRATRSVTLYRVWNFIPRINDADGELENYRAFCHGRHRAFVDCFGADSERRMPAASAVGTPGDELCTVFLAGSAEVRYVENPDQVPAYRYPTRYGPRAPSFARASIVDDGARRRLYVSGTSSIRGSESLHRGDVAAQLDLALDNIDTVARAAGMEGLGRSTAGERLFRLYLRRAADWDAARTVLERRLLRAGDRCGAIEADICRSELLVEIEALVRAD